MQELAFVFGGRVAPGQEREFGKATMKTSGMSKCRIFEGLEEEEIMWMSHGDKLHEVPTGFTKCGSTDNAEFVAIQNLETRMWGLQFHPEVTHSPKGKDVLKNFVIGVCESPADWKMKVSEAGKALFMRVTARSEETRIKNA